MKKMSSFAQEERIRVGSQHKTELENHIAELEKRYRTLDDETERTLLREELRGERKKLTIASERLAKDENRYSVHQKVWWHEFLLVIFIVAAGALLMFFGAK